MQCVIYIFGSAYLLKLSHSSEYSLILDFPKYLAGFGVIYASIMAIQKNYIKSVLVYSTIAQLNYMLLLIFTFKLDASSNLLLLQIGAHALAKINLFFCFGYFYLKFKAKAVADLNGLFKRGGGKFFSINTFVIISFIVSILSLVGIPPFIGFDAKFELLKFAILEKEYYMIGVIVLGSILSWYYLLPICIKILFSTEGEDRSIEKNLTKKNTEVALPSMLSFVIIAILCINIAIVLNYILLTIILNTLYY